MPDRRRWRGPHPRDAACFDEASLGPLRDAVEDLSWLLERGYPARGSLTLVGDRHTLRDRQRLALQRCAAGEGESRRRITRRVQPAGVSGKVLAVDGFNLLITLEAALSGGLVLLARDGTARDLASMSAHYRRVRATRPALRLVARFGRDLGCSKIQWYLDKPVANSHRLRRFIEEEMAQTQPPWEVLVVDQVDHRLATCGEIVVSADSKILDRCGGWLNLARLIVEQAIDTAWVVDLEGR